MRDRIDTGRLPTAVGEDFPAFADAPRIDRGDNALAAKPVCHLRHDFRSRDRCAVDANLVRTGQQQGADIVRRPNPAANREWHEADLCRARDNVEQGSPPFMACGDIKKA